MTTAKSNGGIARAESLTPQQRTDIASKAATDRWEDEKTMLKSTHRGQITIGDITIPCAVLENGTRILSETGVTVALGSTSGLSGAAKRKRAKQENEGVDPLPAFLNIDKLKTHIEHVFKDAALLPIKYKEGRKVLTGYPADMLPKICEVWLRARDAGDLIKAHHVKSVQADIIMRGLAHIGIVALVDEATGYQQERDKDELHKLLSVYLSEERLAWAKRFPDEFYKQLYRLRGWQYPTPTTTKISYVGKLTNMLVYEKLPQGVLNELQIRNPTKEGTGYRKWKHHQFLSEDIGQEDLRDHLLQLVAIMRISKDWDTFMIHFDAAFPTIGKQLAIEL
jgi:hypothetical protein